MRTLLAVLAALGAALLGRSLAAACARRGRVLRQAMDELQRARVDMLERRLPLHLSLIHIFCWESVLRASMRFSAV